jgi:hypothetical protein
MKFNKWLKSPLKNKRPWHLVGLSQGSITSINLIVPMIFHDYVFLWFYPLGLQLIPQTRGMRFGQRPC